MRVSERTFRPIATLPKKGNKRAPHFFENRNLEQLIASRLIRMAPVGSLKKYTSYATSKSQRAKDVAMMRAADRAQAAYYARQRTPMEGIDYPTRNYPRRSQAVARAGEIKGMDTSIANASIVSSTNTNGSANVLNLVQAGTGSWNRVGKKIRMKSLRLSGVATFSITPTFATGASQDTSIRMVVVYDKQPSGAALPSFDTIFGSTDQSGTESTITIFDPPRYDNMERFTVLRDCKIDNPDMAVPAFGSGPTQTNPVVFDEFIKLKGIDTVYSGQSVPMTISDISTGGLYVYFRSLTNSAIASCTITGMARLRYYD